MRCFPSPAAYLLWRQTATAQVPPCVDCNSDHQARMIAQGRCERPEVVFVMKKGELVGRIPNNLGALVSRPPRSSVSAPESAFVVKVATGLLGDEAMAELVGIGVTSLPHYRNGARVLPGPKLELLRSAVRRGAGLLLR